jgi:hypothetical protein
MINHINEEPKGKQASKEPFKKRGGNSRSLAAIERIKTMDDDEEFVLGDDFTDFRRYAGETFGEEEEGDGLGEDYDDFIDDDPMNVEIIDRETERTQLVCFDELLRLREDVN